MEYRLKTDSSTLVNSGGAVVDMTKVIKTNGVDTLLDLNGTDVTQDFNIVKKSEVVAVDTDITNIETTVLPTKLTQAEHDAVMATKIPLNNSVTPTQLLGVTTPTPTTNYVNTFEYSLITMSVAITNYDPVSVYEITTDIGNAVLDSTTGVISIVVNEVLVSTPRTLSVTSNKDGLLISDPLVINISVEKIPYLSDQIVVNNNLNSNAALRVGI